MRIATIDVTAPSLTAFRLNRPLLISGTGVRPASVSRDAQTAPLAAHRGGSGIGLPPACSCGAHPKDGPLNTQQAAEYLGVSKEFLEKLRTYGLKRGKPPKFSRIGRRVVYTRAELDAYVERNSAETTSEYDPKG